MTDLQIHAIEVQLLLESLRLRHGYDFSQYARASLERRLHTLSITLGYHTLSAMIPRLLHDTTFVDEVIAHVSVPVTEMFRDPPLYLGLRDQVIPYLATYPRIQLWLPGCATGEEAYSLAILLHEEGLLNQTTLFATDINDTALAQAESGVFSADKLRQFSRNYQLSGGKRALEAYFHRHDHSATIHDQIRHKIVFAHHNLVSDGDFAETHLIYCANVLIYFNDELRNRVLGVFRKSLVRGGFLCLGPQERLLGTTEESRFTELDPGCRIYRSRPPQSDPSPP
ncbi:MAG: protein-glutamate O-methyltransferase CheR [Magnetococcales bacterium]|nr:protein-glutamate O-methyltransferase CheR [Magnetococcales bacterium]